MDVGVTAGDTDVVTSLEGQGGCGCAGEGKDDGGEELHFEVDGVPWFKLVERLGNWVLLELVEGEKR